MTTIAYRVQNSSNSTWIAWGITLLGVSRETARFISEAERSGLGTSDYKSLKLVEVSA